MEPLSPRSNFDGIIRLCEGFQALKKCAKRDNYNTPKRSQLNSYFILSHIHFIHWMDIFSDICFIFNFKTEKENGVGHIYLNTYSAFTFHDDVIKWKHFPCYWPFVRGIHRSPVNSPHKGRWRGAFMFSLMCAWINGWVNNCEAGDLRCHRAHYDVTVMSWHKKQDGNKYRHIHLRDFIQLSICISLSPFCQTFST